MAGLPDLQLQAFLIGAGDYSYYHCSCANAFGGNIWGSASKWLAQPQPQDRSASCCRAPRTLKRSCARI